MDDIERKITEFVEFAEQRGALTGPERKAYVRKVAGAWLAEAGVDLLDALIRAAVRRLRAARARERRDRADAAPAVPKPRKGASRPAPAAEPDPDPEPAP